MNRTGGFAIDTDTEDDLDRYAEAFEEACEQARREGLYVIEATDRQLFVDLDDGASKKLFEKYASYLVSIGIAETHRITRSKSRNWHGWVDLTVSMSVSERVAFQLLLGSDRTHEYLTLRSYLRFGDKTKIVFFEPKEQDAR